jgi:farnesyl diphosphate synthase
LERISLKTNARGVSTPLFNFALQNNVLFSSGIMEERGNVEAGALGSEDGERMEIPGRAGGLCEQRVREVFEAVGLRRVYAEYEERVYKEINEQIDTIPEGGVIVDERGQAQRMGGHTGLKKQVFRVFLDKIYGRRK